MQETVLEVAVLRELQDALGGDAAVVVELIDEFVADAAGLVDEAMATAFDDNDSFRRAVHSLKTTSATFGATKLSSICRQLELDARQQRTIAVEDLDALVAASREATAALRAEFGHG